MDLYQFLNERAHDFVTDAEKAVRTAHLTAYERDGTEIAHQRLKALCTLTVRAVKERNLGPMVAHADHIAEERFNAGYQLWEVQTAFNALEEVIWNRILHELPPGEFAEALGLVSTILGSGKDALARKYVSLASKTKAATLDLRPLFTGLAGN